jgi:ElaB/YqjD/DUF883 family membrane-anchored ribosome-binding protein
MDYDRDPQRPTDAGTTGGAGTSGFGTQGTGGYGGSASDAGTRAGSYDRKFAPEEEGGLKNAVEEKLEEGRERMHDAVESGKERVGDAVDSGRGRLAGQLEHLGDRLEERGRGMEDAGGVQRRAGQVAVRASEALDSSADYLRTHDAGEMRDDLERAIRDRPLLSVGMAVGAGFLLARLMRD